MQALNVPGLKLSNRGRLVRTRFIRIYSVQSWATPVGPPAHNQAYIRTRDLHALVSVAVLLLAA